MDMQTINTAYSAIIGAIVAFMLVAVAIIHQIYRQKVALAESKERRRVLAEFWWTRHGADLEAIRRGGLLTENSDTETNFKLERRRLMRAMNGDSLARWAKLLPKMQEIERCQRALGQRIEYPCFTNVVWK